jgi:hypothetical protein
MNRSAAVAPGNTAAAQEPAIVTPLDLRPLTIGELLDRAFTLYRRHWTLFVGIMAVPSVFSLVVGLLMQLAVRPSAFDANQSPDLVATIPRLLRMLVVGFALTFVSTLVYATALGATTLAVADAYAGTVSGIRDTYGRIREYVGRLLLTSVLTLLRPAGVFFALIALLMPLTGLPIFLWPKEQIVVALAVLVFMVGMLVAILLAWLFALRYVVSVPALVLERVTAREAIRRSVQLTKGHFGRVFLLALCMMVVTYASIICFQGPFILSARMASPLGATVFWLNIASVVSGTIGLMLTTPVGIVGFAVLYYDLRVRKEALDLHVMMGALDAASGGTVIASRTPPTHRSPQS